MVDIFYDANVSKEPHDEFLGLDFWSVGTGGASFRSDDEGLLVTDDKDIEIEVLRDPNLYYRRGAGRYYRRQFTREEFNGKTDLRIEVTVKVLSSVGSPAATCVQWTTPEGRTFGLGFLRLRNDSLP